MKARLLSTILTASALANTVWADPLAVTGVDDNGSAGVYQIAGQNYWWMCIEPSTPTTISGTISVDGLSLLDSWDQHNTERLDFYTTNSGYYSTAIPKQVAVMEYVLDTYLPWNTLAGASGRFAEQDQNSANYANDDAFYNPLFAVQNFLAETYGKAVKEDFTSMADYVDYNLGGLSSAEVARSNIFQNILGDVAAKDASSFFDTYTAQHGYMVANTLFAEASPSNYQDALIIFSFAPVPEAGSAFLLLYGGIMTILRRRRTAR